MRKFHNIAATVVLSVALPLTLINCGGDDEADIPPPTSAGNGGEAGEGGTAGVAGTPGTAGTAGEAGKAGIAGEAGTTGVAGEDGVAGTAGVAAGAVGQGGNAAAGAAGAGDVEPECDLSGEGKERVDIELDIEEDTTLISDKVWTLSDFVKIHDGATLTIEPCTRIEGTKEPAGVLVALQGGRIVAEGTADEPILFTSQQAPGSRAAGDWGGVVLLGRAPTTAGEGVDAKIYEGLTDTDFTYGGDDEDDDSGVLSYVRIEFAGYEIEADKEVNGLSMAAVGAGTRLDHIMINNVEDDCFEWWGGTVTADNLICNNAGDDMFDADEGWQGGGMNWFGRRTSADHVSSNDPNGFEWDSINDGDEPRTSVKATNVTLCGTGEELGTENGMVLRELITGQIDKLALLGFEYGIDTRNAFMAGDVTISNSLFWELSHGVGAEGGNDDPEFDDASPFTEGENNEDVSDDPPFTLADCQNVAGPDDAVLVSEVGALTDGAEWMTDGMWVDWSEE